MSSQFYDYLNNKLLNYFEDNAIKRGDRYFISFDEDDQVLDFYNSLKNIGNSRFSCSNFFYTHEMSTKRYETFAIELNDIKLVVSESVSIEDSFSNTLRNGVLNQEGYWEDTALLFICTEAMNSIDGGAKDLQKEGMPLNVKSISTNLEDEIDDSRDLNRVDKQITKFSLNILEEELYQTTLWDYETILTIINKGHVSDEDLKELNLFKDEQLHTLSPAKMHNRLKKNHDTFIDVKEIFQYEDKKEKLEKMFNKRGVEVLSSKEWYKTKWKNVKKYKEGADKPPLTMKAIDISPNLDYWERSTGTGKRRKNIIVFNPDSLSEVSLKITFDQNLDDKYIQNNSKELCKTDGNSLIVNFGLEQSEPTFKQIKYVHNNQNNSAFTFNIAVLKFKPDMISSIKSRYTVNFLKKKIEVTMDEDSYKLEFGFDSNDKIDKIVNEDHDNVYLYDEESIVISDESPVWVNEEFNFKLYYYNDFIPFLIKESGRPLPKRSHVIWNEKRKNKENFIYNGVTVVQDVQNFSLYPKFKEFLKMEREIIANDIFYAEKKIDGSLEKKNLSLGKDLEEAYLDILKYYKTFDDSPEDNLPSLVYINDVFKEKYEKFIKIFNEEVSDIKENSILSSLEDKKDLLKLGCIKSEDKLMFSPLSPLNIAYQLEIAKQCKNENLPENIVKRLVPNNLVPYICLHDEKELYRPIYQDEAHEWLIYEKSEDVSIGTTNEFISNVVTEKLNQFVKHFTYLFSLNDSSPIKINLINIKDDKEVVKGVFNFIRSRLPDKKNNLIPVEVNIYEGGDKSSFDDLFDCKSDTELDEEFGIKVRETKMFDSIEIIHRVQNNISYYKHPSKTEYEYAHLSFYKVNSHNKVGKFEMNQIESGLSLNGLLSSVNSTKESGYRIGFGTKNISDERIFDEENLLINTVIKLNELVANSKNFGIDPYSKNESVTTTIELDEYNVNDLYEKSHWVTFIEPTFGIEYFDSFKNNLIIIHYSDQYTSSSKYDTITVTNKSTQYEEIIKDFLKSKDVPDVDEELPNIIKMFNAINGEWLLRIISTSGQYGREKLSIISAIKYCLAILDHKDIVWIPVSMEEHIRIARNIKLDRNKGIFDPKLIKGEHSDDLLFIGVKFNEDNRVEVIFYPIEVKIGLNKSSTMKKGKIQLEKTYKHLRMQLQKINEEGPEFRNKFFRNFFIQLLLSNEKKLAENNIWKDKCLERIEDVKDELLNDDYDIIYGLKDYIGIGSVVSFKTEPDESDIFMDGDKQIIVLPEEFAYNGLAKPIEKIYDEIQNDIDTDIFAEKLLYNVDISDIRVDKNDFYESDDNYLDYDDDLTDEESEDDEESDTYEEEDDDLTDSDSDTENDFTGDDEESTDSDSDTENDFTGDDEESSSDISNIRALIGTQVGYHHKVYWEFGHLRNKHMLIQGKSGEGKTYFIQRMLKELSNQGVPSIIIDYTDGFRRDQLEPAFLESLEDKIEEHVVFINRFPLNPFKKYNKEYAGQSIPQDDTDVASRFKSIIKSVYNFGDVQQMTIYNAVLACLKKYGENFNFPELKQELIDEDTSVSNSVLTKLIELFDFNPFDSENEFSWEDALENSDGKITIIQLTTLSKDIQKVITEIVLRDLWNYKQVNGSKDNPFIVVLDEFHNLDLTPGSPSSLILKEGRKYGWSGWFSTQSIQGYMKSDVINDLNNVGEKIYFHPTNISEVAKVLATDGDRKKIESDLNDLTSGSCFVQGPAIDSDGKIYYPNPLIVKIDEITTDKN